MRKRMVHPYIFSVQTDADRIALKQDLQLSVPKLVDLDRGTVFLRSFLHSRNDHLLRFPLQSPVLVGSFNTGCIQCQCLILRGKGISFLLLNGDDGISVKFIKVEFFQDFSVLCQLKHIVPQYHSDAAFSVRRLPQTKGLISPLIAFQVHGDFNILIRSRFRETKDPFSFGFRSQDDPVLFEFHSAALRLPGCRLRFISAFKSDKVLILLRQIIPDAHEQVVHGPGGLRLHPCQVIDTVLRGIERITLPVKVHLKAA